MDDRALVEALLARDPHAPGVLVERYQAVVFALCHRMMGHRQDAEDVAQESFVRALRGIAGFDPDRPVRPWLLGIAANLCASERRRLREREIVQRLGGHRPLDEDDFTRLSTSSMQPAPTGGCSLRSSRSLHPSARSPNSY